MLRLALVGFGAIGRELAARLADQRDILITHIVTTPRTRADVAVHAAHIAPGARVVERLELDHSRPDRLVECAGHGAIEGHVIPALAAGVSSIVTSVGALAAGDLASRMERAAAVGRSRVRLISGAIGGLDALDAARRAGLEWVVYTGRKPPRGWLGTAAEEAWPLETLDRPRLVFEGTAREAARRFPKNANVAATVALAGIGLDRTQVRLYADPGVERNVHEVDAVGTFGRLSVRVENLTLPDNPKTSALTVYSLLRAVQQEQAPWVI